MKFLCDQCKAKYQISDEKIAGKTVRMKCRKCGHQIEVRAAVTESSVSQPPPKPVETVKTPFGAAPRPPAAPRPGGLATSLSAAKPPAPRAAPAPGALANAFNRTVQKDDALELLELSAADEWYVAINGVPVGPIRIAELRRKAAAGAVTDDSLVWQEGMEEWRPVKAIHDLASVVREAATGGRMSLVTPPPAEARPSQPSLTARAPMHTPAPPPAGTPLQRIAKPAASSPAVGAQATARSNVVPITSRLATAERLEPTPGPAPMVTPDPFAVPPAPMQASASLPPMQTSPSSPLFAPAPIGGPFAPSIPPPEPERKGPPLIAIAMIALAVAFGVTAGIVVFMNNKQQPQPVVIQVPTPVQPAPTNTVAAATPPATAETPTAPAAPTTTGAKPVAVAGGARPSGTGTAKGNAADLTSLLGGAGGPTQGPSGPGASGGGSSLTSDQVQAVVRNRSAGVKRTCWERGGGDKASTVSVRVNLGVNGSGQVTDATATGTDPIMNKCIENQVRTWQFPPTGATSRVEIPFHFVAQ